MPNSPHQHTRKHMAPTKENHHSDLGVKGLTLLKAAHKQATYSYSAILANRLTPVSLSIVALQIACLSLVFDNGVVTRCIHSFRKLPVTHHLHKIFAPLSTCTLYRAWLKNALTPVGGFGYFI